MFTNVPIMMRKSLMIESCCVSVMYSDFASKVIQYFVSLDSFKAIYSFEMKSALLWACSLSAMFAHMLVPLRSSCFEMMYSAFSLHRYLYIFIMRSAKSILKSAIMIFLVCMATSILQFFNSSTFQSS